MEISKIVKETQRTTHNFGKQDIVFYNLNYNIANLILEQTVTPGKSMLAIG